MKWKKCTHNTPLPLPPRGQTFEDQILRLQVEALAVTLPPQSGDGGVVLPTAVGLHGRGGRQDVPLGPQRRLAPGGASTSHGFIPRHHPQGQVVVGDVDVARVVPFVGIILAALAVPPGVRLVPVVGADRDRDEPQSAECQKETRHG